MLLTIILYVPVIIFLCIIGSLTYLNNRQSETGRYFALFTICVALWVGMLFVDDYVFQPTANLWEMHLAALLGTMAIPIGLLFYFKFPLHQEVKKATSELATANQSLKTMDGLKDDFISIASHQLRTPAMSVHEALKMLNHTAKHPLSQKERRQLESLAEVSSEHIVMVVADMMNVASIQAGRLNLNKTPANFQTLVDSAIKQTSIFAKFKDINLIFNKPSQPIWHLVDTAKINEALCNYIENAIKYSPANSTIIVRLIKTENRLIIEVSDQGIGVPQDQRNNLFGKFYRADNARAMHHTGDGVGLFVVKSIAEAHGGDAYYRPQKVGSLFGFWVPIGLSKESGNNN